MPEEKKEHIFGPVPSRRLGLSLGVDIVPFKVCTLDCIYCQVGRTTKISIERKEYVSAKVILDELKERLKGGVKADVITLSGSGEPTLNSSIGKIISGIKKITDIPVAVLTNGTLFFEEAVRRDCCHADIIVPSLDAGDERTFRKINRVHPDINIEKLITGLCAFRREYRGQLWLEVFIVEGVNTGEEQISNIKGAIERIRPDKIQLNTAVRPTADAGVAKTGLQRLEAIAAQLGPKCEIIADFSPKAEAGNVENRAKNVLSMLKRRPCTLGDICSGLGISQTEAMKYTSHFEDEGSIVAEEKEGKIFFKAC